MKRKYINIGLIIFFVLFAFILPKFFNKKISDVEFYSKEYFPIGIKGIIVDFQFSKGGATALFIKDSLNNQENISVDKSFRYNVDIKKQGNLFEKIPNSNKCVYIIGDSIYYFDCYEIPKEVRDSLGKIEEWPREIVGKWQIKKK